MQIIDISLSTQTVAPIFDAVQYDSGRECGFHIQEDISSYDTVETLFDIADGRSVTAQCLIDADEHLVTFVVPINVTRISGVYTAVIRFLTDSTAIHTFPFKIDVASNPSPDGDTYERAYEDMVQENARAEANNTAMESYISAYGSISPSQLATILSDLQNIWSEFNDKDISDLANQIAAVDTKATTNATNIATLQTLTNSHTSSISTINTNVSGLTNRMSSAESDIDTLEGLANNAVYHD